MSAEEIKAIVKARYETGAYGGTAFVMSRATLEQLRSTYPAPQPSPAPFGAGLFGALGDLLAIPIRHDDTMAEGEWRLVTIVPDPVTGACGVVSSGLI